MHSTASRKGRKAFLAYYRELFPNESEFEEFVTSLSSRPRPVLRYLCSKRTEVEVLWAKHQIPFQTLSWYSGALMWPSGYQHAEDIPGVLERLLYPMNASSLIPVIALDVKPSDRVLDACAAPGGKALMIADQLLSGGEVIANDVSSRRRQRMKGVFVEYGASNIEVWGRKAEMIYRTYPDSFDKILIDAPCSAEKHTWQDPYVMKKWTRGSIMANKTRQYAMLCGLLLALKVGGRMVYSTCAVTPEENEEVVARFLNKKSVHVRLVSVGADVPGSGGMSGVWSEQMDIPNVRRILPHRDALNPMFIAVFERL